MTPRSILLVAMTLFLTWGRSALGIEYTESFRASNSYQIEWCTNAKDVQFRLNANARGWLGIGFNSRQQMANADVIMATGEGAFQDAFADFRGAPARDAAQNATLGTSTQQNNVTTIEFSRPIVSPDSNDDYNLDGGVFLIWALSSSSDSFTAQHSSRGFSSSRINFSQAAACGGLGPQGDFNGDGNLDVADVELLRGEVFAGTNKPEFDVNADAAVNSDDLREYLKTSFKSYIGDANLDGQFSTRDLVVVFGFGEYEDDVPTNSTWGEGDWTGDSEFSTRDLVFAFQDGGFEAGPRQSTAAVPETGLPLSALLLLAIGTWRGASKQAAMRFHHLRKHAAGDIG